MPKKKKESAFSKLNMQRQHFCLAYVGENLYNGTDSARTAGYKGNDVTLATTASRLMRIDQIQAAMSEIVKKAAAKLELTPAKVLHDLETTRIQAAKAGQFAVAAKASELQGKYLKLFVDRVEHVHHADDATTDELTELLKDVAGKLNNADINAIIAGTGRAGARRSEEGHGDHPSDTTTTH